MSEDEQRRSTSQPAAGPWAIPSEASSSGSSSISSGTRTKRSALSSSSGSRAGLSAASLSASSSMGGPWATYEPTPSSSTSMSTLAVLESGMRRRPTTYMLGSPGRRLCAKLIDRLLLGLALTPGLLVHALSAAEGLGLGLALGLGALALGFEWWMAATLGQTPGKYLLGLRVIGCEGEAIGLRRGVGLRVWAFALIAAALAGVPLLLDALFVFSEEHQSLHDRLAKTQVIVAGSLGDPFAKLTDWFED